MANWCSNTRLYGIMYSHMWTLVLTCKNHLHIHCICNTPYSLHINVSYTYIWKNCILGVELKNVITESVAYDYNNFFCLDNIQIYVFLYVYMCFAFQFYWSFISIQPEELSKLLIVFKLSVMIINGKDKRQLLNMAGLLFLSPLCQRSSSTNCTKH